MSTMGSGEKPQTGVEIGENHKGPIGLEFSGGIEEGAGVIGVTREEVFVKGSDTGEVKKGATAAADMERVAVVMVVMLVAR